MKKSLLNIFLLIVGNALLAISVSMFILPANILSGGVAGIAVILKPFTDIPQTTIISILVYSLFIIGWIFLGTRFAANTLISTIIYPLLLELCSKYLPSKPLDPLLAAVFGGLVGGLGIGIVMREGASTGGMDIPPLIMHRYLKIELTKAVMITDVLTIMLGCFAYDLEHVLLGLVAAYSTSITIDKMITFGGYDIMSVQIISNKYESLSQIIQTELGRGITIFDAVGGYKNDPKKVIFVVIDKRQFNRLCTIISTNDPQAFLIANKAFEVVGNGFSSVSKI